MIQLSLKAGVTKILAQFSQAKFFWFAIATGLLVRLVFAPITSYAFDVGAFLKHDELFYIAQVNPLYWWSYGVPYLGILLGFFPLKLVANLLGVDNIYVTQTVLKLPFILADVGIAAVLYHLVRTLPLPRLSKEKLEDLAKVVALYWWVHPFAIFISSVHGMFDAIPTFFVLLAVFYALHRKVSRSYAALAIATTIKLFPFFLFPLFFFYFWQTHRFKKQLWGIGIAFLIGVASFAPLLIPALTRETFLNSLFFHTSGVLSDPSAFSLWRIFFDTEIIYLLPATFLSKLFFLIFIPSVIAIFVKAIADIRANHLSFERFLTYVTILLLLLLPYNTGNVIQYYIWVLPFLIIWALVYRRIRQTVLSFLTLVILVHFFTGTKPFDYFLNAFPTLVELPWPFLNGTLNVLAGFVASVILIYFLGSLLKNIRRPVPDTHPAHDLLFPRTLFVLGGACSIILFLIVTVNYEEWRLPPVAIADRDRYFNYIHEPVSVKEEEGALLYTFDVPEALLLSPRAFAATSVVLYNEGVLTQSHSDTATDQNNRHRLRSLFYAQREDDVTRQWREYYEKQFSQLAEKFVPLASLTVNGTERSVVISASKAQLSNVYPNPSDLRATTETLEILNPQDVLKKETVVAVSPSEILNFNGAAPLLYLETQVQVSAIDPWYDEHKTLVSILALGIVILSLAFIRYLYCLRAYVSASTHD